VILDALRQHANVLGVLEHGCAAFGQLALSSDANCASIEAGGIPVILDAMRQHANVSALSGVQEWGRDAIAKLACIDANHVIITEAGGIPMILDAMRQHANVSSVQEHGCDAMVKLAWKDEEYCINDAHLCQYCRAWRHSYNTGGDEATCQCAKGTRKGLCDYISSL